MDKRKLNYVTVAFVVLTMLVVGLMLSNTLRRSAHITLPDELPPAGDVSGEPSDGGALTVVEIAPNTVQTAIATLERPINYSRPVTVEYVWPGGSGVFQTMVTARAGLIRTDRTMPDGQTRHTIAGEKETYIWYNDERKCLAVPQGPVSSDNEQAIPTYEEILQLPVEQITTADYREITGQRCIYVEASQGLPGDVLRYWVSVDSGLLVAAEKLLDGETVYRMGALELDLTEPDKALFILPDGTKLL